MENRWSDLLDAATAALTAGDAVRSRELLERLGRAAGSYGTGENDALSTVWDPFIRFLGRRGYFVATPAQLRNSISDIREMGPGFDLYDLAAALSGCDAVLAAHLRAPLSRAFPELRPFAPVPGANDAPPSP